MSYYFLFAILAILIIWSVGSYLVVWSIEEPKYSILEKKDGYEIREYKPYIKAETTVSGNYDEATNQGFRIIADYIFGNNLKKESISMTTPVIESAEQTSSEKIAMTVPVLESASDSTNRTIAFVLPSAYSLDTLPLPNNSAVKLIEVKGHKVAVLRFGWYPSASRVEAKKALLLSYLARDKEVIVGEVATARYNPPLSMPLVLRSEIIISIE